VSLVRRPLATALIVFAVALPAFLVIHSDSETRPVIPASEAVAIARADPQIHQRLAGSGQTSARVTVLDAEHQRVGFFRGSRLVIVALVGPTGTVVDTAEGGGVVGNKIANPPAFLIGLTILFLFAMATVPLLSLRNLDVLALASFTLSAWLTIHGRLDASLYLAYPVLAYLAFRFLWISARGQSSGGSTSLYWRLTAAWSPTDRRRLLRLVAAGLATMTAVLAVSSSGVSDVAFASLAGATDLIHGTVPYGHIPDFIIHGDTYPPLNYVVYVPAAALWPVTDAFSDPQGALVLTAALALIAALAVYRVIARHGQGDPGEDLGSDSEPPGIAGLRGAIAWLSFPPVLLATTSGSNDVVLAFCLLLVLGSVASARRSAILLGVAAWVKLTPLVALPVWIARMRWRESLQAVGALGLLSAAIVGGLITLGGTGSVSTMVDAMRFQFERRSLFSLFGDGPGLGPLQAVAQAVLLASVVGMTLAVRRDAALRDDPVRLAAMLTSLMLFSQLAANYWSWAYTPWVIAPALLVLAPALAGYAPEPRPEPTRISPRVPAQAAG
jgi:Glycosyltransferase family 87